MRRVKEGESGGVEEGWGLGVGGVYFLWEDRWRRVLNSPTVPAETTLLCKLFHSPIVLGKKLFLKTGLKRAGSKSIAGVCVCVCVMPLMCVNACAFCVCVCTLCVCVTFHQYLL